MKGIGFDAIVMLKFVYAIVASMGNGVNKIHLGHKEILGVAHEFLSLGFNHFALKDLSLLAVQTYANLFVAMAWSI